MKNNKIHFLLMIGLVLIGFSLLGNQLNNNLMIPDSVNITKPNDAKLLDMANSVTLALQGGKQDAQKLANLYNDLATLIEIDDGIIKNTEEIREANRIAGQMSKLNIKDKYPDLANAANTLVTTHIGDDNITLSEELRKKSVDAFRALAWACQEVK